MPTVVVLTADRVIAVELEDVVGGIINVDGDLILQTRGGAEFNLGNVKDHGGLAGLSDDDHPQYALSDGSRGDFATPAQGTKADESRPNTQAEIDLDGGDPDAVVETVTITNDGTDTATWLDRMVYQYRATVGGTPRKTSYFNEKGELRVAPANYDTTGARFFVKEDPTNPSTARSTTVPVVELMDDRVNRNSLRGWLGDGSETRNGIKMSDVLVLGPSAPVPAGTPANTVILRTT